jgi:pimeloyl-ACP methyl ester carboxylesterase
MMKRREAWLAAVGVIAILAAIALAPREPLIQDVTLRGADCTVPASVIAPEHGKPVGTAMVLHGLCSSRKMMMPLAEALARGGLQVYVPDLPGHGENMEPFSTQRAGQCTAQALETLEREGHLQPEKTLLVGHSMGGAVAIHLADDYPVAGTVAISPAPSVLPLRMPSNLLVISAQYDFLWLKSAVRAISRAEAGERTLTEDFVQRRAFGKIMVPRATHVSLLFDSRVSQEAALWAEHALEIKLDGDMRIRNGGELASLAALLGLCLLFPAGATIVARLVRCDGEIPQPERQHGSRDVGRWLVAAGIAVLLLKMGTPLNFIRLQTGSYLASLLLLTGALAVMMNWREAGATLRGAARGVAGALALGFVVTAILTIWLHWQVSGVRLAGPRLAAFLLLIPFCGIYSLAEETELGAPGQHGMKRWRTYMRLRAIVWLAAIFGIFLLGSGQVMILLLVMYLGFFSLLQRMATDALRLRTGALPAVIFGAILTSWFIAAIFPLS